MKTVVAPYTTRAICLRISCKNGMTIRLTRYPYDLKMSNGQVYLSTAGADFSAYTATASMSPSAIDLEGFFGFAGVTRDAISSGVFDNARVYMFACNFLSPVEDYEEMASATLGKATLEDDRYIIEEMGLIDALNQSVGKTYTALCVHEFGPDCGIALGPLTVTGTITNVTSRYVVRDSARAETADYFTAGTIVYTSGNNAGLKAREIKSHAADGTITVFDAFYYLPQVGDAYSLIPGCRKRLVDCQAHGNVVNRFAFDHIPANSSYSQIGGI